MRDLIRSILGWHHLTDRVLHIAMAAIALTAAFLFRFDFTPPPFAMHLLLIGLMLSVATKSIVFQLAGFHKGWMRYVESSDLKRLLLGNLAASAAFTVAVLFVVGRPFPRSIFFADFALTLLLTSSIHFVVLIARELTLNQRNSPHSKRILLHGLGENAVALLREIRSNPNSQYEVVGLLDEHRAGAPERFLGIPVFGTHRDASEIVGRMAAAGKPIDEIVVALSSTTGRDMSQILADCRAAGVPCKTLPPLTDLLNARSLRSRIRNVSPADLLGREPVQLEKDRIHSSVAGRAVLVTGAAGSIGSEICRQVIKYAPSRLIALDQAESDLYRLECELRDQARGAAEFVPQLGDIRDYASLADLIRRYQVDSIFHAAAYKHVPMLEHHVVEGVRNNVLGTWNLVRAASEQHVANLLMISSDKAVNPTSVMGATKRVCELIVSSAQTSGFPWTPNCVSVRFGNVLGSNGSVVPLFQMQIESGGPLTVTHPDMRRFFMTIPEAVMLVLQASTMGTGSEIFVLDMGKPMKIVELAENMIFAAGLVPHEDIEIRFTGMRPGEKLYEELGLASERIVPTHHERIKVFADPVPSWSRIANWVEDLKRILGNRDSSKVVRHLNELVPEFHPDAHWTAPTPTGRAASVSSRV